MSWRRRQHQRRHQSWRACWRIAWWWLKLGFSSIWVMLSFCESLCEYKESSSISCLLKNWRLRRRFGLWELVSMLSSIMRVSEATHKNGWKFWKFVCCGRRKREWVEHRVLLYTSLVGRACLNRRLLVQKEKFRIFNVLIWPRDKLKTPCGCWVQLRA